MVLAEKQENAQFSFQNAADENLKVTVKQYETTAATGIFSSDVVLLSILEPFLVYET